MNQIRTALTLFAVLALPAFSDDAVPPRAATSAASGGAHVVVAKDPVTGELRPATPAERQQLLGKRPLVSASPEILTLPDGTVMLKERPEDANYAVVTRNANSTLSYSCVQGAKAARTGNAPAAALAPKSADR